MIDVWFPVNEEPGAKVLMLNEWGFVIDLSECNLFVAENGQALRAYIENLGDPDSDLNSVESELYDAVQDNPHLLDSDFPVGFQHAYRQGKYSLEYIPMPGTMATAFWLSRNHFE